MKSFGEAGLALAIVLLLGAGFWLFSGEDLDLGGSTATTTTLVVDTEAAARGMALATNTGCLACHTVDGTTSTGPTWKGMAGSSRPLESGESVIADTAYLFNSIIDPAAQVVAGFPQVMPTDYSDQLTEAEINDLVAYMQSLAD